MSPRTIPLPAGTRNTSINAPEAWLTIAQQLAHLRGLSWNEFAKQCIEKSVESEQPTVARKLMQSRLVVRVSVAITLGLTVWKLSTIRSAREFMPTAPAIVETLDSIWMFRGGGK